MPSSIQKDEHSEQFDVFNQLIINAAFKWLYSGFLTDILLCIAITVQACRPHCGTKKFLPAQYEAERYRRYLDELGKKYNAEDKKI